MMNRVIIIYSFNEGGYEEGLFGFDIQKDQVLTLSAQGGGYSVAGGE